MYATKALAQYTYFSDNFDNKTNPLDPPQVGFGYNGSESVGSPFSLSTNPALGTQSLQLVRNTNGSPPYPNPTLECISLNGVLVDQNTVTFSWDEYIGYEYNAPVQVNIGYTPISTGSLQFLGVNDFNGANPGTYFFYEDQDGDQVSTGVKPTIDGWDHLSLTLNLSEFYVAGGPNYMTGTMTDFTVSENGGPTQTLASDIALPYAQIPTLDPASPYDNTSVATMQLQMGPSGDTYYDNLLMTGTDAPTAAFTPHLVWNNSGASSPDDGVTWDTTQNNWNNGVNATTYNDNAIVDFTDSNNGHYNVTLNTTVKPTSVNVSNSSGNYVISGSGSIAGSSSLSMSGTGTLTLDTVNTYSGGTTVSGGLLIAGVHGALPDGALSITNGAAVQLAAGTGATQLTSLSISANSTLDITNNHVIISYVSGSDPIAAIQGYVQTGYNSGGWNGLGIISSTAQSPTNSLRYGVGWADGADNAVTGISSGQIELKYTLLGDANLDGSVNGSDFSILAANFGLGHTNWDQGNFLFGSSVNGADFSALAANFGQGDSGADGVTQADLAALAAFAAANGLRLPTSVPEPACGAMVVLGIAGAVARRRRTH
jgi:autotransporter-associated beta strand protein